jgi:Trk K+ transport system NAD-binding subunit
MKPLRDFFLVIFFIMLGAQLDFSQISLYIVPIIALSAFALIGKPIIIMFLMGLLGYTKRNSFLVGISLAQISEFSLILFALAGGLGYIDKGLLSMMTIIALITIGGSTYLILNGNKLYPYFSSMIHIFERKGKKVDEHKHHKDKPYDFVLFGHNRIGFNLIKTFKKLKKRYLVVDYNPDMIKELAKKKIHCRYGDAGDIELLNELELDDVQLVVSTITDMETDILLIKHIRSINEKAIIMAVAQQIDDAILLYEVGATYVILPHFLGGHHASTMIEEHKLNVNKFMKEKVKHLRYLRKRKGVVHSHPLNEKGA